MSKVNQGQIINCQRCGRIFKKVASPFCPDCSRETKDEVHRIYHFVLDNPNLTLEEIAEQCKMSLGELESLYYAGNLGMAATTIKTKCHKCGIEVLPVQKKGRFCMNCADKVEEETRASALVRDEKRDAGVDQKPETPETQRIRKPRPEKRVVVRDEPPPTDDELMEAADEEELTDEEEEEGERFGFIRRT